MGDRCEECFSRLTITRIERRRKDSEAVDERCLLETEEDDD